MYLHVIDDIFMSCDDCYFSFLRECIYHVLSLLIRMFTSSLTSLYFFVIFNIIGCCWCDPRNGSSSHCHYQGKFIYPLHLCLWALYVKIVLLSLNSEFLIHLIILMLLDGRGFRWSWKDCSQGHQERC